MESCRPCIPQVRTAEPLGGAAREDKQVLNVYNVHIRGQIGPMADSSTEVPNQLLSLITLDRITPRHSGVPSLLHPLPVQDPDPARN